MADFEQAIERAIAEQDIPGCVLAATNRDGTFTYAKAFGKRSVREGGDQSPLQLSTVMWIASCTKLMTSISAIQLVERGLFSLDSPVYTHIPELKSLPVLEGFRDDGSPIETPHKNPITLRRLLTHTSGLSYDNLHPKLQAWLKHHNKEPNRSGKLLEWAHEPLVFEPGTSWAYGSSVDFVGLLVERVTKMSLEDYMRKNLWEPLGIKDMTFHLSKRPDLNDRMADMSRRDEVTGKVVSMDGRLPWQDGQGNEVVDCFGGHGVFASPEEYIKLLRSLLVADENEQVLKKETVELFFSPQLGEGSKAGLKLVMNNEVTNNAMGGTPLEVEKDWGLGGLLLSGDSPDGKREGTMIWGGYPNLIWFVDRKTGICGLYSTQVTPPGDSKCATLNRKFEAAMYEMCGKPRDETSPL